jgi:phenylalanyl-tRNA synthetase beta chain
VAQNKKRMTISYQWLLSYLPEKLEIEKLSRILTSVGLEVEGIHPYEEVKGALQGLVIGEVLTCEKHPDADKLKVTTVNIGATEPLQIVCGAPNVAAGQKVMVATIGTTIYPTTGEPLTMKKAKIRGVESHGMLCAEDELGLGTSHEGIMVLPSETVVGTKAVDYLEVYTDYIIEIGLTPNHMDAQSHIGVARDVVAYMNHHEKKDWKVMHNSNHKFTADEQSLPITVTIENAEACKRYAGVSITNVTVQDSPKWLQQKLKAIGVRPINNIVDATNYFLHATGQPLHAFDAAKIEGNAINVKCCVADTLFVTLDEKERKLSAEDLMICNANSPMCIAGVFGGLESGVTTATTSIFLESAWFSPLYTRKSSIRHGLRTDAAVRFEKGVDISNTVQVLKAAALLIKEIAGGTIASDIVDVYPVVEQKKSVSMKYHYLKKLSGKNYHPETIKNILTNLAFEIDKEGMDEISFLVPFHKTDIGIPADLVEEIMRIDGLDNVEIPKSIHISPSVDENGQKEKLKEKIAVQLVGIGLQEIFTNSITNSIYVSEAQKPYMVKMVNNLSTDLDAMRTTMLETGLQSIAYNLNRKNNHLQFFEFGRTYSKLDAGQYKEQEHLAIYSTGEKNTADWKTKTQEGDFYFAKAITEKILKIAGVQASTKIEEPNNNAAYQLSYWVQSKCVAIVTQVSAATLKQFDIKQAVQHVDIDWTVLCTAALKTKIQFQEISKFPTVERDIAILVDKSLAYEKIETAILKSGVKKLTGIHLFDVFENEKLGVDKKSMAINITFVDAEKTLTDKEVEGFMQKIKYNLEKETGAVLR